MGVRRAGRGGAGIRQVAEVGVGRGRFPRARGAELVTDTHARVRSQLLRGPAAPRPRDPRGSLRGPASAPQPSRISVQRRPWRPQPEAPSSGLRVLLPASPPDPPVVRDCPLTHLSAPTAGSSRPMLAAGDPGSLGLSRAGQPATMVALRPVQLLQGG